MSFGVAHIPAGPFPDYAAMVLRIRLHWYDSVILSGGTTSVLYSTDNLDFDRSAHDVQYPCALQSGCPRTCQ
jgi:hypothetical protein